MFGKAGITLRTYSLLKDLPVFESGSGKKLGEVCDLGISSNGSVVCLLVKSGEFFKKTLHIPIEQVGSFGKDGVMVNSHSSSSHVDKEPEYTMEHHESLTGKSLLSIEGSSLGILVDVYFLEELGTIVGYEITDGFFSDITNGKQLVETVGPPAIGKDAIIVSVKSR